MNRTTLWSLALCALALSACGPGEVTVTAEIELMDPETGEPVVRQLEDLPIQLLPFDRDQIFDSLAAAASSSEPMPPEELRIARDSIAEAEQEWRESESRWLALRERMQEINAELEQYNPAEAEYRRLFNEFDDAESAAANAEATKDEAFETFDRLQQQTFSMQEEYRAVLTGWEEEAFAAYGEVLVARLDAAGRDILADTTGATGQARFAPAPGEWWVYGRYPFATDELYWNEPISVERGTPIDLTLNRDNAETREIY